MRWLALRTRGPRGRWGGGADASAHFAVGPGQSLGGRQQHLFCPRCLARACWHWQGVGGSAWAGELRAMLEHWRGALALGIFWGVCGWVSAGVLQVGVRVGVLAGQCCWGDGVIMALAPVY